MDDDGVTDALCAAARRGVVVRVRMTFQRRWVAALNRLTACGAQVSDPREGAGLYIHAKAIVVDGREAFVGSQNFSVQSLQYNRELGLVTSNRTIVAGLSRSFRADFSGPARR
jgi:cardiolipin synthase